MKLRTSGRGIGFRPFPHAFFSITLLAAALGAAPARADALEQPAAGPAIRPADILAEAIRIVTVNPPGDEEPLARYFVARLAGAGIEAKVIRTPSGGSSVGRAAAWGRLRGRGKRPAIALLSHLDVVPANPDDWSVDPFGGHRAEGYVVGRGATDAKGLAVAHLLAITNLAQRGITLDRDVVFLATPDEETGGRLGAGYLVKKHPELLDGVGYLLTEGGGILLGEADEPPVWSVAVTEKNPCWLRVVSRGTPGHSAVPRRDAAVPRLIAALMRVQQLESRVHVVPPVAEMFAALAPLAAVDDRAGFENLADALENDASFRNRFLANRQYAALVRNTLTTTVLQGSSRTNVVPPVASAHIDARLLPGESCGAFAAQIRSVLADPGIAVEILLSFPSQVSSPKTPLFRAIGRVAAASDPGAVVVPRVIAGFTDAHYFREAGITSYGFVPRWLRTGEESGVHGPDERLSEKNLERGILTLIAILMELDRVEAED